MEESRNCSAPVPPPVAASDEALNPWFSIWTRPRATMRQILDTDPRRMVLPLAALGGIAGGLGVAIAPGVGDTYPMSAVLAGVVVGGAISGIVFLFVLGFLLRLTGGWIGGQGNGVAVRCAMAWSNVLGVWGLLLWLPRAALLGGETLYAEPPSIEGEMASIAVLQALKLFQFVIAIWGFFVTLKCLGEAHRFSAWRSFGACIIALVILALPIAVIAGVVVALRF